jgi:hypothetical protein
VCIRTKSKAQGRFIARGVISSRSPRFSSELSNGTNVEQLSSGGREKSPAVPISPVTKLTFRQEYFLFLCHNLFGSQGSHRV